jgi:N-acetyl-gamma-glutamyl-phosphate reductase
MSRIRAAIVGGTGYTGVELLRLLAVHPGVEVTTITSRSEAGQAAAELFPNLRGHCELEFEVPDAQRLAAHDVVFFATPHGVAQDLVPALLDGGTRVIDLSADFRLRCAETWARWYGRPHACPELIAQAVYGLPERHREALRDARLVAMPGCYPTAVQLGFLPLLEGGLVDPSALIASAGSGVSGAGRQARLPNLLTEAADSLKAYAVPGHRHLPEIEQGLADQADGPVALTFVPHLVPMIRGIHATLFARLQGDVADLQALFEDRFRDEPFVDVMPAGSHPETRSVRGANVCRIAVHRPQDREQVVVLSVIDNLVKGAAGQAIQVMNILFDIDERTGLHAPALLP